MAIGPTQFGRLNMWAMLKDLVNNNVGLFQISGAPVDGTSGSLAGFVGKGALLTDITNGQLYINTGTKASPTWTKLADAAGDIPLATNSMLIGVGGLAAASAQPILGTVIANNAVENIVGSVPVIHRFQVTALTGDQDIVLTHKTRIIDFYAISQAAGAGDTVLLKNVANAITDALDMSVDATVIRAGTIDNANQDVAAGAILRVTGASGVTAECFALGLRIA